jgi:hypothetical protein
MGFGSGLLRTTLLPFNRGVLCAPPGVLVYVLVRQSKRVCCQVLQPAAWPLQALFTCMQCKAYKTYHCCLTFLLPALLLYCVCCCNQDFGRLRISVEATAVEASMSRVPAFCKQAKWPKLSSGTFNSCIACVSSACIAVFLGLGCA